MGEAERRIAQLERQVALLRAQLGAVQELPNSSVEARLRALLGDRVVLDALPVIVTVLDRQQKVVYLNRTIPGREVVDMYGADARDHVRQDDRGRYTHAFEEVCRTGEPTRLPLRTLSDRHWDIALIPVKDGDEVVFVIATCDDVTERVLSEQALKDSEARLRHALSASGMGTWSYHILEEAVTWDEVTAGLFGRTLDRAPRTLSESMELIHSADRERVMQAVRACLETGKIGDLEYRALLEDGSIRHLLGKVAILRDETGTTLGLRGGVFDVTARRELESELQLARKMQAVGQLTSGVAHNLNNALAVIIPNAEECQRLATDGLAERIDDIAHAARRAAEMVRQLMLFARPHVSADKRPFDVTRAVRRIVDMCRKTFDRRIAIELAADGPAYVCGDEGQIEQVLLNICLNARDAVSTGDCEGPRIQVCVGSTPQGTVRVEVRDNGGGMEESVRARVFEPFFTTKDLDRGSGLGLASAYAIVTDHEGQIRCSSDAGSGTVFGFDLPATHAVTEEREPAEPPPSEGAVANERVLIVDDEPAVRRVLASLLESGGYRVEQCQDGHEAVGLFESGRGDFDAVLLDRSMPGMGGEQVLARLRALGVGVPVILLTGDPGNLEDLAGVALLMHKPVRRAELLRSVRSVLDEAVSSTPSSERA